MKFKKIVELCWVFNFAPLMYFVLMSCYSWVQSTLDTKCQTDQICFEIVERF